MEYDEIWLVRGPTRSRKRISLFGVKVQRKLYAFNN